MNRCRRSCARKMNFSLSLSPFEIRRQNQNKRTREENVWNNQLTKRLNILSGTRAVRAQFKVATSSKRVSAAMRTYHRMARPSHHRHDHEQYESTVHNDDN